MQSPGAWGDFLLPSFWGFHTCLLAPDWQGSWSSGGASSSPVGLHPSDGSGTPKLWACLTTAPSPAHKEPLQACSTHTLRSTRRRGPARPVVSNETEAERQDPVGVRHRRILFSCCPHLPLEWRRGCCWGDVGLGRLWWLRVPIRRTQSCDGLGGNLLQSLRDPLISQIQTQYVRHSS